MKKRVLLFAMVIGCITANAQLTSMDKLLAQKGTYEISGTDSTAKDFYAFELSSGAVVTALWGVERRGDKDTTNLLPIMFEDVSGGAQGGIYFLDKIYKGYAITLSSGTVKLFIE